MLHVPCLFVGRDSRELSDPEGRPVAEYLYNECSLSLCVLSLSLSVSRYICMYIYIIQISNLSLDSADVKSTAVVSRVWQMFFH